MVGSGFGFRCLVDTDRLMGSYKYRVISRVTILITHTRGLITPLIITPMNLQVQPSRDPYSHQGFGF